MKTLYKSQKFVCVNKSGRKLYEADHIENIEFRLNEKRCQLREIYKRENGNAYAFYTSNTKLK